MTVKCGKPIIKQALNLLSLLHHVILEAGFTLCILLSVIMPF